PGSDVETFPVVCEREQERYRPHQVRCDGGEQQSAFVQRLTDQFEVELFEVTQTAVDEFAGSAGGTGGKITCFDQPRRQSTGDRVQCDTRTDDAPSDDEDVEFFRSEEHTSELQSRFDLVCR